MKKRLFASLMTVLVILALLVSCNTGGSNVDGDGDSTPISKSSIYGAGLTTYIIRELNHTGSEYITLLNTVKSAIESKTGGSTLITDDGFGVTEHEIVFGDTNRPISTAAKEALNKAIVKAVRNSEDEEAAAEDIAGYTVYAQGGSVAIVWSDERFMNSAVQYFIDNYLAGDSLELKDGYAHSETYSYLAYLEEQDEIAAEAEWAAVEEALGTEAMKALKIHYGMFDERFYLWLADLYDPDAGAFYYSNSGRDTLGYIPDIESTKQIMNFLDNSGMTDSYGGWEYALPDDMGEAMLEFAKSLQSSKDGLFYHPLWVDMGLYDGSNSSNTRLGRDAKWATSIISAYYEKYKKIYTAQGYSGEELDEMLKKYMPYYNVNEYSGSLGAPGETVAAVSASHIAGRLSSISVSALASRVVLTSSNAASWKEEIRSIKAWRAYLYGGTFTDTLTGKEITYDGFDLSTDSYSTGSTVGSWAKYVKSRDAAAKNANEATGYETIMRKFFDESVNRENGLWETDISYGSVNGLMKISELYNEMKWELPCPDKSLASALSMAMHKGVDMFGEEPTDSVDVYNPLVSITALFTNVKYYNNTLDKQAFEENGRQMILDNATELIKVTTAKTAIFGKLDGSYSYRVNYPPQKSQGMPVATGRVNEGDVNGGCIACTGVLGNLRNALGISSIAPNLFYSADMEKFLRRIEELQSVIKDPADMNSAIETFDDFDGGTVAITPENAFISEVYGETLYATVVTDGEIENKYLETVKINDTSAALIIAADVLGTNIKENYKLVFECDIKWGGAGADGLGKVSEAVYLEIMSGTKYINNFRKGVSGFGQTADGSVTFGDKAIAQDEWFKLRVEITENTDQTLNINAYINDMLAVSSVELSALTADKAAVTLDNINSVRFQIRKSQTSYINMCFDNIYCSREELSKSDSIGGGESEEKPAKVETYDNFFTTLENIDVVTDTDGNKYLQASKTDDTQGSTAIKPAFAVSGTDIDENYKIVFESDIKWKGADKDGTLKIDKAIYLEILDGASSYITAFRTPFGQTEDGSITYSDTNGNVVSTVAKDTWFKFRLEVSANSEDSSKLDFNVYVNGDLVASKTGVSALANNKTVLLSGVSRVQFHIRKAQSTNVSIAFDNTYCSREELAEDGMPDTEPSVPSDPSDPTVPDDDTPEAGAAYETYDSFTGSSDMVTVSPDFVSDVTDEASYFTVSTDSAGNKYLEAVKTDTAAALIPSFAVLGSEITENYKIVFETDIMWGGAGADGLGEVSEAVYLEIMKDTKYINNFRKGVSGFGQTSDGSVTFGSITVPQNEWFEFRIEITENAEDSSKLNINVYINDSVAVSSIGLSAVTGDSKAILLDEINSIRFQIRKSTATYVNMCFDNTYCSREALSDEETAEPSEPTDPPAEESGSLGTGLYASSAEGYDGYTASVSGTSVVTGADGNKYLEAERSGLTSAAVKPEFELSGTEITENYKIVFETDIKWGGAEKDGTVELLSSALIYLEVYDNGIKSDGTSTSSRYDKTFRPGFFQNADGSLVFGDAVIAKNQWFNFRVEISENTDTENTLDIVVYVDGTVAMQETAVASKNDNGVVTLDKIESFMFHIRTKQSSSIKISFDNTYFSRVEIS